MDWVRTEHIENNFSYFPFLFLHSFKSGIRAWNLNCSLVSGSFPFLVSFLSFFYPCLFYSWQFDAGQSNMKIKEQEN